MRKKLLLLLITIFICSSCGRLYTEEQVNETVVAKIKEVAAMQKVNVTIETRIIKETVLVTVAPEPTTTMIPLPYYTITPLSFERTSIEDILAALSAAGIKVSRFYYTPGSDEIGILADWISQAMKFTIKDGAVEATGYAYSFPNPENLDKAYTYLTSQKAGSSNKSIFRKNNILLEIDPDTPDNVLEKIKNCLETIP